MFANRDIRAGETVERYEERPHFLVSDRYVERNWRGPLLANTSVDTTLAQFQDLERRATPQQKRNWRFQQALYRAYYDAYLRARLIDETAHERRAMERLSSTAGTLQALSMAETELAVDPLALVQLLEERLGHGVLVYRLDRATGEVDAVACERCFFGARFDRETARFDSRFDMGAQFVELLADDAL